MVAGLAAVPGSASHGPAAADRPPGQPACCSSMHAGRARHARAQCGGQPRGRTCRRRPGHLAQGGTHSAAVAGVGRRVPGPGSALAAPLRFLIPGARSQFAKHASWHQQKSNLNLPLRRRLLYPLSYGGEIRRPRSPRGSGRTGTGTFIARRTGGRDQCPGLGHGVRGVVAARLGVAAGLGAAAGLGVAVGLGLAVGWAWPWAWACRGARQPGRWRRSGCRSGSRSRSGRRTSGHRPQAAPKRPRRRHEDDVLHHGLTQRGSHDQPNTTAAQDVHHEANGARKRIIVGCSPCTPSHVCRPRHRPGERPRAMVANVVVMRH